MGKFKIAISILLIISLTSCKLVRTLSFQKEATSFESKDTDFKTLEIPFALEEDWIVIDINVRHETKVDTEKFIFDSGAFTLLFSDVAAKNGWTRDTLKKGLTIPVATAMGTQKLKLVSTDNLLLQIAEYSVFKQRTMLIARPERMPEKFAGLLGAEIFEDYFTEIDFTKNVIRLYDYGNKTLPAYPMSLEIKTRLNNNPFIHDLNINGIKLSCLIDFGYPGSILLQIPKEEAYSQQLNKYFCKYVSKTPLFADAANHTGNNYLFLSYTNHLTQKETQINDLSGNIRLIINPEKNLKGNIGCKFFKDNFDQVAFDWKAKKLFLEKKNSKQKQPSCKDVYFSKADDTVKVSLVRESSRWYQMGLQPGNRVLHINGGDPNVYWENHGINVDSLRVISDNNKITTYK